MPGEVAKFLVEEEARNQGMDPDLARRVAKQESGFNPRARSSAGAIGTMQLMPGTARQLGVDPNNPAQNIAGGVKLLKSLTDKHGVERGLAAYNAGEGRLKGDAWRRIPETRNYTRSIMAGYQGPAVGQPTGQPKGEVAQFLAQEDGTPEPTPAPKLRPTANTPHLKLALSHLTDESGQPKGPASALIASKLIEEVGTRRSEARAAAKEARAQASVRPTPQPQMPNRGYRLAEDEADITPEQAQQIVSGQKTGAEIRASNRPKPAYKPTFSDQPHYSVTGVPLIDTALTKAAQGVIGGAGSAIRGAGQILSDPASALDLITTNPLDPILQRIHATPKVSDLIRKPSNALAQAPTNPVYRAGQALSDVAEAGAETEDTFLKRLPRMAGGFAPVVATGPAAPVVMGAQTRDALFQEALAHGATEAQAAQAATEGTLLGTALGLIPGGAQAREAEGLVKTVGREALLGGALGGGQKLGENVIAQGTYDPARKALEGVPQAAAEMAAVGPVMGLAGKARKMPEPNRARVEPLVRPEWLPEGPASGEGLPLGAQYPAERLQKGAIQNKLERGQPLSATEKASIVSEQQQRTSTRIQQKLAKGETLTKAELAALPTEPEAPGTLQAQIDAVKSGGRKAVLVTPGEQVPARHGLSAVDTAVGRFLFDANQTSARAIRRRVGNGTYHELLGIVEGKSNKTTETVVARSPEGQEQQAAVVSPERVPEQAEKLQEQFPEATVGTEPAAQVIADRQASSEIEQLQAQYERAQARARALRTQAQGEAGNVGPIHQALEQANKTARGLGMQLSAAKKAALADRAAVGDTQQGTSPLTESAQPSALPVEPQSAVPERLAKGLQRLNENWTASGNGPLRGAAREIQASPIPATPEARAAQLAAAERGRKFIEESGAAGAGAGEFIARNAKGEEIWRGPAEDAADAMAKAGPEARSAISGEVQERSRRVGQAEKEYKPAGGQDSQGVNPAKEVAPAKAATGPTTFASSRSALNEEILNKAISHKVIAPEQRSEVMDIAGIIQQLDGAAELKPEHVAESVQYAQGRTSIREGLEGATKIGDKPKPYETQIAERARRILDALPPAEQSANIAPDAGRGATGTARTAGPDRGAEEASRRRVVESTSAATRDVTRRVLERADTEHPGLREQTEQRLTKDGKPPTPEQTALQLGATLKTLELDAAGHKRPAAQHKRFGNIQLIAKTPDGAKILLGKIGEDGHVTYHMAQNPEHELLSNSHLTAKPEDIAKLPTVSWNELGTLGDAHPPTAVIEALGKKLNLPAKGERGPSKEWRRLSDIPDDVAIEHFPEVFRNRVKQEVSDPQWADMALKQMEVEPRPHEPKIIGQWRDDVRNGGLGANRVDLIAKGMTVAAYDTYRDLKTFGAWSKKMVQDWGQSIKPKLTDMWEAATKASRQAQQRIQGWVKTFMDPKRPGQEGFVRIGKDREPWEMTGREMVDGRIAALRSQVDAIDAEAPRIPGNLTRRKDHSDLRIAAQSRYPEIKALQNRIEKLQAATPEAIKQIHRQEVERALKAGKPVPQDVLADYPDLKSKTPLQKFLDPKRPGQEGFISVGGQPSTRVKTTTPKPPEGSKFWRNVSDVTNAPRSLMSSLDVSAPLRQGAIFSLTEPKASGKAAKDMFRALVSNKANYEKLNRKIESHPDYKAAVDSGVDFTKTPDANTPLTAREESFMSGLVGKLPHVKYAEQAYVTFLNSQRLHVYSKFAKELKSRSAKPEAYKDIARFINYATGRGDLGKFANSVGPALNALFFSPRYAASRIQTPAFVFDPRVSGPARRIALRKLAQFAGVTGTALALAKLGGAEVGTDPDDADFLKIKVGDTRYDVLAGFQQYMVLASRLTTGFMNEAKGDKNTPQTDPNEVVKRFLRGKLAPVPSALVDWRTGKNIVGEPFTIQDAAADRLLPMIVNDARKAWAAEGITGAAKTLPSLVGVGVQSYKRTPYAGTGRERGARR